MTIYDLSEFEINSRLAKLLGLDVQEIDDTRSTGMTPWYHHQFPHTVWVTDKESPWRQFCATRSWEDIGSTIARLQIALVPESHNGAEGTENSEKWMANVYYDGGEEFTTHYVDRPELAASIAALVALSGSEFIK
ncbi:DUF2591 family protein [Klebsiella grimontii]|uniref:DUF2591 family protein n=1 Tax=Klebsiella grimontii TaxID=2058152 RepID=UPI001665FC3D|nr:DUF2591 family protein [Klebsiella grimontii]MBD0905711.1 DUF2591 family protein [Klebsiella grimontii]